MSRFHNVTDVLPQMFECIVQGAHKITLRRETRVPYHERIVFVSLYIVAVNRIVVNAPQGIVHTAKARTPETQEQRKREKTEWPPIRVRQPTQDHEYTYPPAAE